jgi:uncharacterized membrane protein
MRDIRDFEGTRYVPEFSVTIAVMLAVANVAVLIYFIHHVAMSISADQVIARVVAELDQIVDRIYPDKPARAADDKVEDDTEEAPIPELSGGYIVTGRYAGYIQTIDVDSLARIAADADVLVQVRRRPGDFISAGEALALVVPEENGSDELSAAILSAFVTGSSRTAQQDVRFVLNQLVELAARALSPGINDPYTAVTCLDRMGSTFRRLATRPFPGVRRFDADGEQRVLAEIVTFDELVETAFDPIRVYGREHLSVVLRLLVVLGNIGLVASESRRAPLAHLAELAYEGSFPAMATAEDQARLELSFQQTMKRLDTEPLAGLPSSA